MEKWGKYYLPKRDYGVSSLEEVFEENPNLETIFLFDNDDLVEMCQKFGFRRLMRRNVTVLDLTKTEEELWGEMKSSRRRGIRKAVNTGVTFCESRDEDLEECTQLWIDGYCNKFDLDPEIGKRYVEEYSSFEDEYSWLFNATLKGKIVASMIVSDFEKEGEVLIFSGNSSLREFQKYNVNEFMMWEVAKWAKKRGFLKFNLTGGTKFKDQFSKNSPTVVCEWSKSEASFDAPTVMGEETPLFNKVNSEMLAFIRMEREKSPLPEWYEQRYWYHDDGISPIDRVISRFVLERFGTSNRIIEVGAGFGQCCILLSAHGVETVPIEADATNFERLGRAIELAAEKIDGAIAERCSPFYGKYPEDALHLIDGDSILFFRSLTRTMTKEQEDRLYESLRMARGIIIEKRMFFKVRDEEGEREEMIGRIMDLGFGEPETIMGWDDWNFGFAPDSVVYLERN